MPITANDIQLRLSTTTGPGDSTAQTNPNASLGEYASTTQITNATLHNLFDSVSSSESDSGDVEYRCIFVYNSHATDTFFGVTVWAEKTSTGGATVQIGVDTTAASDVDNASDQAVEIVDESTAPAGITFVTTSESSPVLIGNLAPDFVRGVWIKRTVPPQTEAKVLDEIIIKVKGTIT